MLLIKFANLCKKSRPYTRCVFITLLLSLNPLIAKPPQWEIRQATELSWSDPAQNTNVEISTDGENWTLVSPTRQDGSRSYWVAPNGNVPQFAKALPASLERSNQLILELADDIRQVRIEIFNPDTETWETQILAQVDTSLTQHSFTLKKETLVSNIRILTSKQSLFNFPFTASSTHLDPTPSDAPIDNWGQLRATSFTADENATVEESDIWRLQGERLFFFNANRGLQIIDLSQPKTPTITHSRKFPGYGQELYAPTHDSTILITQGADGYSSALRALSIQNDELIDHPVVDIQGHIIDSRMVGNLLYTASRTYEYVEEEHRSYYIRQNKILISAIDFSNFDDAAIVEEIEIPDQNAILSATSTHLMVASHSWRYRNGYNSDVFIFQLNDPKAPLKPIQSLSLEGRIFDKFKMGINNGVITTIAQTRWTRPTTVIETFPLNVSGEAITLPPSSEFDSNDPPPEPLPSNRLGRLEIAKNERLHATRILEHTAYIVTFQQVDPLWIIDLSDPAEPSVSGELEVPGWSTYIQAIDDYLFSVGIEDGRVALSLFDISDPSHPSLSDRIYLGEEKSRSYSEANYDEKAISILPEKNAAIIPYNAYSYVDEQYTHTKALQIVRFSEGKLALAGSIENEYTPRRSTLLGHNLISVSNHELLVYDAANLSRPEFLSRLELSWNVDQSFQMGEYLAQLNFGNAYNDYFSPQTSKAEIRISPIDEPENILSKLEFEELKIAGASLKNDLFILLLSDLPHYPDPSDEEEAPQASLTQNVYDLSDPLSFEALSSTEVLVHSSVFNHYTPTWVDDEILIWNSIAKQNYFGRYDFGFWPGPRYNEAPFIEFHAFDLSFPKRPNHLAQFLIDVDSNQNSSTLKETRLIYPWNPTNIGEISYSNNRFYIGYQSQSYETENWMTHYGLKVADFSDPSDPRELPSVKLPGNFSHLYENNQGGILLFTETSDSRRVEGIYQNTAKIQASVLFEDVAFLIDEYAFPANTYPNSQYHEKTIFTRSWLSYYANNDPELSETLRRSIQRIRFNDSGKFEEILPLVLESPIDAHKVIHHNLFAISRSHYYGPGELFNIDATDLSLAPEMQAIALSSPFHSLNQLTLSGDSLLFSLNIYGAFVYPFNAYTSTSPSNQTLLDVQSELEWTSLQASPLTQPLNQPTSDSHWRFQNSNSPNVSPVIPLLKNATPQGPLSFQFNDVIQFSFQTELDRVYEIFDSNHFESWNEIETFTGNGNTVTYPFPLSTEIPIFLKVE